MKRNVCKALAGIMLAAVALLAIGCGGRDSSGLDPKSPVVITIWHAYNAVAKAQFDALVLEFNETVGQEQGIVVDAVGYGTSEELEEVLYDSANQIIGADPLPNIFSSYPDNAYRLDKTVPLASLNEYFTKDELAEYRPEFLEEGIWDDTGVCKMVPVSKSTELLYLNRTEWDRFSRETGASRDMLGTWEGLSEAAGMYYEWSGGRPFLGMNSFNNYAVLTAAQLGVDVYEQKDGSISISYTKEAARKAWDAYYVPHIKGWFESSIYNQDGIKSGKLLAYIGSSAGAGFFPEDVIMNENQSHPIEGECLPYPVFEDGASYMTQRGANMAVFLSDRVHEYASAQFLKWFTRPEQNIRFAVSTGYLPVKTEALKSVGNLLGQIDDSNNTKMVKSSVKTSLEAMEAQQFYIRRPFHGSYELNQVFDASLENRVIADLHELERRTAAGEDREEVEADLLGKENFHSWYETLIKEMAGKAYE